MFVNLMKNDLPVCRIYFGCLSLSGIHIYKTKIMDPELLPFHCRDSQYEGIFHNDLQNWMDSRVIPNSDPDLDGIALRIYRLDETKYGRMFYYQYLGAFMAYMVSDKDDYWINPTHPQILSYGLVDPHWTMGYICRPACSRREAEEMGNRSARSYAEDKNRSLRRIDMNGTPDNRKIRK